MSTLHNFAIFAIFFIPLNYGIIVKYNLCHGAEQRGPEIPILPFLSI